MAEMASMYVCKRDDAFTFIPYRGITQRHTLFQGSHCHLRDPASGLRRRVGS